MDHDFILVGAGSAGCVLANRLSADPGNRVLLLEAGPEDRNPWIHVPLGYGKNVSNPLVNWCFQSEPEAELYGQSYMLPRGKVIGGSSSINGMVYVRGQPRDYDIWGQMECAGWSYDDVLPYFRKAENNERGASDVHGVGGPLDVSDITEQGTLCDAMVWAQREVVLSGGAFNSPQLLELSGVGDPVRLGDLGIPVVHELKGVGSNLQDHFVVRMRWRIKNTVTLNEKVRGLRAVGEGLKYLFGRTGALTMATLPIGAFIRSHTELETPDIQFQIFPGSYDLAEARELDKKPGVTIGVTLLHVEGRGHVHAKSPDPTAAPVIWHNMLSTETDRRTAVTGKWAARRLMEADAVRPYVDFETTPGPEAADDDAFLEYARRSRASNWHPAGTCKMGIDSMAVVDPSLSVHGMEGLQVVDASVMRNVISGNTNAPTIMIAEKAADVILAAAA